MSDIIFILLFILQIPVYGVMIYHTLMAVFSFFNKKAPQSCDKKKLTFAVVVAAHNEETVIYKTVRSILESNYDKNLFRVFVVADNCTDNTASLAKEAGALVLERENPEEKGKGYALLWAFDRLFSEYDFDAVVIVDADNILSENFLKETAYSLNCGYDAVQGYIDAKNPYDSWVSASYYITLLLINKMYQSVRHNTGFPVQLNGTGFAVKTKLLKELKWDASCLTEDIELTVKMALSGKFVAYNENAVIYDEKPVDFSTSFKQRTRWMQGQSDVAIRYFKALIKNLNLKILDCLIYLIQPFIFVITGILTVAGIIQFFIFPSAVFPVFQIISMLLQFISIPIYLIIINKFNIKILKYYIPYLIFMYSWIPVSFMGIINRKKKVWFHTKHSVAKERRTKNAGKKIRLS